MGYWIGEWIHVLLYVLLFSGITIFFQEDFKVIILRIKMGRRLRLRMKQRKENPFIHHMELLAGTVTAGRLSGCTTFSSCCTAVRSVRGPYWACRTCSGAPQDGQNFADGSTGW